MLFRSLLRKALGTDTIVYKITDGKIRFLWFHISGSPEEVTAYTQLITALVEMAKNSKRITAKERTVENEKYAFRCFLLRLGFIGEEYKQTCKTLLKNFEGSSAFRTQEAADKYRAKQEGKKEDENRSEEDAACLE